MKRKRFDEEDDGEEILDEAIADDAEPPRPARGKPRRPMAEILLADDDLLVVNKPAGLPMAPIGDGDDSLRDQLCGLLDVDEKRLRLVDRLDAGASGVLVVARNADAETDIGRQFAQQSVERLYLALIHGGAVEASGTIDLEIGPDRKHGDLMRIGGHHPRPAVTEWKMRDRFVGYALLECRPRTDRTHQVRLHLQAMGMPLAVDPEYGGAAALMLSAFKSGYHRSQRHEERPLIGRLTLHSASLEFRHPRTKAACKFEAPLPKDFRAALNQLDKYGRIGGSPAP